MVAILLCKTGEAWDLLQGGFASFSSAFLASNSISDSTAVNNRGLVHMMTASTDPTDPDELASTCRLTALLKADLSRHKIRRVDGYAEMHESLCILVIGDAAIRPRALLCVNCGATIDMSAVLQLDVGDVTDTRALVIHAHRPFRLRNVKSTPIVLFHDLTDSEPPAFLSVST